MKVLEIFLSIQGEGKEQGYRCSFIRLAGCNLACRWCDTKNAHENGIEMTKETILEQLKDISCSRVCITGGEPLLQGKDLIGLLLLLEENNFCVDIETNGTIDFSPFQGNATICMDVKCPSSGEQSDLNLLEKIGENDTVKFVVGDDSDLTYAKKVLKNYEIKGEVFFSPVEGSDIAKIARYIITNALDARLQLQMHKIIGVQ